MQKPKLASEAWARGFQDRMTGHEKDAPLNADRSQYLAGYRKACKKLAAGPSDWSNLRPDGTRFRERVQ